MKKLFIATLLTISVLTVTTTIGESNRLPLDTTIEASAKTTDIRLSKPTLKVNKRTATTTSLQIGKIAGAKGYKVYRSSKIDGTYTYIGSTKGKSYTDKGLNYNKSYYYRVRAYNVVDGEKVHSKYSSKITVSSTYSKVTDLTVANTWEESAQLSWLKVKGASKYKIYRSESKNGTYEYVGITTNTYFTDKGLDNGETYYYKVRAYKKIDGVKYNGVYSDKVAVTTSKFSIDDIVTRPTITPAPTPTPKPVDNNNTNHSNDTNQDSTYADKVLVLVNKERAKEGLSALAMSDTLLPAADTRAIEIKQYFAHTRPDGRSWSTVLEDYNISVRAAGENLAYGYNTPEAVVTGWMNSPGHRANILGANFNNIGIGVYVDGNGTVYCTQLFSN